MKDKIMASKKKVVKKAVKKITPKKVVKKVSKSQKSEEKKDRDKKTISQLARQVGPSTPVKALEGVQDILRLRSRWVKGQLYGVGGEDNYEPSGPESAYQACLIGAVNAIDGPHENEITVALACAIGELFPDRCKPPMVLEELIDEYLGNQPSEEILGETIYTGALDFDQFIESNFEAAEDVIPSFNDDSDTTHGDILKVIKRAKEYLIRFDAIKSRFETYEEKIQIMTSEIRALRSAMSSLSRGRQPKTR